ncbi:sigma factor G inhibitor Gin [Clostridium mediterraneense]|uniref:sigma factor G inhibitor Gin n=1 Tax=Clostridium mediterraneense TaxID=1805472 RepID=UPI000835F826|nr:sigma factor G inhibitor Gin [Clostridium mediterraneense]
MNKEVLDKICIICGKTGSPGILILDKKICTCCEQKAIDSDIDSEFYEFYKEKIKSNLVGKLRKEG